MTNKKILISLSIISAIAVVGIGATTALFNDPETSSGNTFTAGEIDLTIDSHCYYNGDDQACGSNWTLKDLVSTADKFFDFKDIKPGDTGVNIISLHVKDNDAWACLNITNKQDNDNGLTEPEDVVDDTPGDGEGELSGFLSTFVWWDTNQNGAFDIGEKQIDNGDFKTVDTLPLADSLHMPAIIGGQTNYIGFAWCAGFWATTPVAGEPFVCKGSEMGNIAQTDSFTADISFIVEQTRNNSSFVCSQSEPLPAEEICGDGIDNDADGQIDEDCTPWINEIHYDNVSTDSNEGVEIAGKAGTDLTGWKIVFYNGSGGTSYATVNLSGAISNQQNGFGTSLWFSQAGIQNGDPDGLALVSPTNDVIQFLSYEGIFMATNGQASGMTSVNIGVSESSSVPLGFSMQLMGLGNKYSDFFWASPVSQTGGLVNMNQTFN
jgi:predicted ribosomally synthesized peptide with SipW-like signal peptide